MGGVGEGEKEETLNTEHRTLNTECRKEKKRPTLNADSEREAEQGRASGIAG